METDTVKQDWEGGEGEDELWRLLDEKEKAFKEEQKKEEEEEEEQEKKEQEHKKQLLSTLLRISSMSICSMLDQIDEEEEAQEEGEDEEEEEREERIREGRAAARKKRRRKSTRTSRDKVERKKTPKKERHLRENEEKENNKENSLSKENEEKKETVVVEKKGEKKAKKADGEKEKKKGKKDRKEKEEDKMTEEEKERLKEKKKEDAAQRKQLLLEVISTEETYCASLKDLVVHFSDPMKSMISADAHRRIFANIEAIQNLSHNFLMFIEQGRKQKDSDLMEVVMDAFDQFCPFFKIYSEYCSNHTYANHSVRQCLSMVPKFKEHCEIQLHKGHQPLASYLILPIQRIPRFKLFLLGLRKVVPSTSPIFEKLEETLEKIDVIGDGIEEFMERIDQDYISWTKIEEIESRFSDADLWFHKFEEEPQIPYFLNEQNFVSLPELPRDTHQLIDYFDLAPTSPRSPRGECSPPPLFRGHSVCSPKSQSLDERARSPGPRRGSLVPQMSISLKKKGNNWAEMDERARSPEPRRESMTSPVRGRRNSMKSPEPSRRASMRSPQPSRVNMRSPQPSRASVRSPEPQRRGSMVPHSIRKKGNFAMDQELSPDFKIFTSSDPVVVYFFSNVLIFGKLEAPSTSLNFRHFLGKKGGEVRGDLEYEAMLPLETTFVLRDTAHNNVLHIINPTRSFALLAENPETTKRWMEDIQTHIDALVETKPSLRARREKITFAREAPRSLFVAEEKVCPTYVSNQISMNEVAKVVKETTAWETANLDAQMASPEVKKHHSLYMQRKVENSPGGSPSQKTAKSPRRRKLSLRN